MRTFVGLSSPYLLPEEFIKEKNDFITEYAPLPQNENTRIRKFLLNVPADLQSYKSFSTFKAHIRAFEKARSKDLKIPHKIIVVKTISKEVESHKLLMVMKFITNNNLQLEML